LIRAPVALAVLTLAILGAMLHPLALVLQLIPADTRGIELALTAAKSFIADLLAWGLTALLCVMLVLVVRDRLVMRHKPYPVRRFAIDSPKMAVAITAFNEAAAIADVVRSFKMQDGVIDVVVVDNNSTDDTSLVAAAAGARVVREYRQGYGHACIRGLTEGARVPGADIVVLTEGDGTFAAEDLSKFRAYVDQTDMVVGTRVVPGLVEDGSQMDCFFTWGNIAVGTLLRLRFWHAQFLGAVRLSDVGCTYRAIRREALDRILPDLVVGGHHFSPHMLVVALYRGLSVIEIPVTFRQRVGISKGAGRSFWKGLQVGIVMIWHINTHRPKGRRTPISVPWGQHAKVAKP
jgi:Glycosyl transferase family 2